MTLDIHSDELIEAVVRNLTQPQRRLLVKSIIDAEPGAEEIPAGRDLRVANALMRRREPLVREWRFSLYLTPFGEQVAKYIVRTGDWEIPAFVQAPKKFIIEL
jgi:hypothetical protein